MKEHNGQRMRMWEKSKWYWLSCFMTPISLTHFVIRVTHRREWNQGVSQTPCKQGWGTKHTPPYYPRPTTNVINAMTTIGAPTHPNTATQTPHQSHLCVREGGIDSRHQELDMTLHTTAHARCNGAKMALGHARVLCQDTSPTHVAVALLNTTRACIQLEFKMGWTRACSQLEFKMGWTRTCTQLEVKTCCS